MFATKDHGEEFPGKIELAVESGKAKISGMSRLSFPRVNVEKKRKKGTRELDEGGNDESKKEGT